MRLKLRGFSRIFWPYERSFFVSGRNILRFLIDFRTNGLFQTREGQFGICDFLIRYALEKVLLIDGA